MFKIVLGENSTDITQESWPKVREALDQYFASLSVLEKVIGFSVDSAQPSVALNHVVPPSPKRPLHKQNEKRLVDFVVEALEDARDWITTGDLTRIIIENGWKTRSKDMETLKSTIRNGLKDYPDMVKSYNGRWGLSSWPVSENENEEQRQFPELFKQDE